MAARRHRIVEAHLAVRLAAEDEGIGPELPGRAPMRAAQRDETRGQPSLLDDGEAL
ncbi:Hypothetical protein AA314_06180 [Archangium gephyra]|uniref:Uncharacterized protein n=1 Tax=Archangium gephyra TaxID=48 RepID=A0AAC8QBS8_9BACT|nr:Hypothetical protein AA314_06180 [Archangium gephyra]